jgi:hypothetical protein
MCLTDLTDQLVVVRYSTQNVHFVNYGETIYTHLQLAHKEDEEDACIPADQVEYMLTLTNITTHSQVKVQSPLEI